jgi:hypothetical protein
VKELVEVTPAIELHIVFGADGHRAFETRLAPLPLDVSAALLNEALDRVLGAVDRQMARYELQDAETKLKEQINRITKYERLMVTMDETAKAEWEASERKGPWSLERLSPQARNTRDATNTSLQRDRADAEALQDRVGRLRERVNGHALGSESDRHAGLSGG